MVIRNTKDTLLVNALNNLGVCYKNSFHFEDAIECYEKVINL